MMFPYSPFAAAHQLFGGGSSSAHDSKKKTEFVKFMDICEYFFVSHPASGQKEGHEHERLMFFSPSSQPIPMQAEISGMAEAIVHFTAGIPDQHRSEMQQQNVKNDYRYITSASSKEVVLVVEQGTFLIGTSLRRKLCKDFDYCPHLATIRTLLERVYNAYTLFYGPFGNLFGCDRDYFKSNLERFLTPYLQLLRVNKTPLVDLFSGVDFLPLESTTFLEVHCLMASCMEEFPQIRKTMFLYQERLIQYSVEKCDLNPLWQFLNQTLIPSAMQAELSPESSTSRRNSRATSQSGFLVDGSIITDFLGELSAQSFPKMFISSAENSCSSNSYTSYELVAYRVLNATACFFIPSDSEGYDQHLLERLCEFIDQPMASIASRIGDKFLTEVARPIPPDPHYQFIYYNPDSLSLRKSFPTSIMSAHSSGNEPQIFPSSMHRLIYETYDKFMADTSLLGQIYLKAENDWWIVLKRVERRILALFLPQSAASTIVEIQQCVDNIVRTRFPNLFI